MPVALCLASIARSRRSSRLLAGTWDWTVGVLKAATKSFTGTSPNPSASICRRTVAAIVNSNNIILYTICSWIFLNNARLLLYYEVYKRIQEGFILSINEVIDDVEFSISKQFVVIYVNIIIF